MISAVQIIPYSRRQQNGYKHKTIFKLSVNPAFSIHAVSSWTNIKYKLTYKN